MVRGGGRGEGGEGGGGGGGAREFRAPEQEERRLRVQEETRDTLGIIVTIRKKLLNYGVV